MRQLLAVAIAALCLFAFPAYAATLTANPATFLAQLKLCGPGGDLGLKAGAYKAKIAVQIPAPGCTIHPLEPGVVFAGYTSISGSGLNFQGLDVSEIAGTTVIGVLAGSQRITFDHVTFHGEVGGSKGSGLSVTSASDVSVTNSEFHHLRGGISHVNATRLTIEANHFHDLTSDGVTGTGVLGFTFRGNRLHDFHPLAGVHPDAVQLWQTSGAPPMRDIVIEANEITRGNGEAVQCLFLQQLSPPAYLNLTLSHNLCLGMTFETYHLSGVGSGAITGNVGLAFPDGFVGRLFLRDISPGVVVKGNVVNDVIAAGSTVPPPANDNIEVPVVANENALPLAAVRAIMGH